MRVVVAPDKFAGTLSAVEAAAAIQAGWLDIAPEDTLELCPMSDGGPGFLDAIEAAVGGERLVVDVPGPLGDDVVADVLLVGTTAYIESAMACGLHLLNADEPDPVGASSAGIADLLVTAHSHGATTVVVGVGGTACTDAGVPMLERLRELTGADDALADQHLLSGVEILVATDVDNPLLGHDGAAAVFAPQKGANPGQVRLLEDRLRTAAAASSIDPHTPGAGAGGGLGHGLFRLGGVRVSGVDTCATALELPSRIATADLVITGEGSLDHQSLRGKVVSGVARVAQAKARPVVVLAGRSLLGRQQASAAGIDEVHTLVDAAGSQEAAMSAPFDTLMAVAASTARAWHDGT
ncbi:MAG TPA: hypothetical protein DCM51_04510 [Actinobacteria bacterium]|nr:hypothetical protein [Actinomycetota bacterium]